MTRQQILAAMKRAGIPLILAAQMSDEQLSRYAEGPCRERLKESEAKRLKRYAERNRAQFARFGQTPDQVVKAFEAGLELFAENFAPGLSDNDKLNSGPNFKTTGDEADTPERKLSRKTSLDKGPRQSTLTPDEMAEKKKEAYRVRAWAEANRTSLEGRGSSPEKVVQAFMADDDFRTADDFIGK